MTDINKLMAEALVECHFAKTYQNHAITGQWMVFHQANSVNEDYDLYYPVCFDQDTLEGHRQADALEDWLIKNHYLLWVSTCDKAESLVEDHHQWRLQRTEQCFKQLAQQS